MRAQSLEPVELVVEFRSGLRIAVRKVDAGDDDAFDRRLDIARFLIVAIAGKGGAGQDRIGLARQNGDAVPGLLSVPHRAIAGLVDRGTGKSASVDFNSCRQTTSGFAARNQRNRFGSRRLILLMLNVAIFM